jgi:hypothetical protein
MAELEPVSVELDQAEGLDLAQSMFVEAKYHERREHDARRT